MQVILIINDVENMSILEKNHFIAQGLAENGIDVSVMRTSHATRGYNGTSLIGTLPVIYNYDIGPWITGKGYFIGKIYQPIHLVLKLAHNLFSRLIKDRDTIIIIPSFSLKIAIVSVIVSWLFRVPLVCNIMEYVPSYSLKLRNIAWNLVLRYSDAYLVISKFLFSQLSRRKPCFYLPALMGNSDPIKHSLQVKLNENIKHKSILLYSSSRSFRDLLAFCMESLSLIRDMSFDLIVTGSYTDGEIEQWINRAKKLGVSEKIKFTGMLSQEALRSVEEVSSALLIPLLDNDRHRARFPQKILHYMLLGKPIISTDIGEIKEHFTNNKNAFLDDSCTPEGFAQRVQYCLSNPDIASAVGEEGRRYSSTRFDYVVWSKALKHFLLTELPATDNK